MLVAMEGQKGKSVRAVLENAMERAWDCDTVIVIMQRKQGGMLWFAPDSDTLANMLFLVQTFTFWMMTRGFGI